MTSFGDVPEEDLWVNFTGKFVKTYTFKKYQNLLVIRQLPVDPKIQPQSAGLYGV